MNIVNRVIVIAAMLATAKVVEGQSDHWGALRPGAHVPGFRVIELTDHGRGTRPPTDFLGRPTRMAIGVPVQIAVWYPAVRGRVTRPMSTFDLLLVAERKERFGRPVGEDTANVIAGVSWAAQMARVDSSRADVRPSAVLGVATAAYRDAPPARGRCPVAVVGASGTLASVSVLAEYLASHGWIVLATPSTQADATLEVTDPAVAIENRVAALERVVATAHTLPNADPARLALIGVNFDSFAALALQMRHMYGSAIVTINGWQTIDDRADHLRRSIWYEPNRIRAPVLNFHWDQSGQGETAPNLRFLNELKYADRRNVILRGLDHFGLTSNPLIYPFASPLQRSAYQQLIRNVRELLDGLPGAAVNAGSTTDSLGSILRLPALPAVPTRSEFLELLGQSGGDQRAIEVFRQARGRDSTVQLFRESDLDLYAFRRMRVGQLDAVVALRRLATDAYPRSFNARNALGNSLVAKGDTAAGILEFQRALELLEADPAVAIDTKEAQGRVWREKIARLRGRDTSDERPRSIVQGRGAHPGR